MAGSDWHLRTAREIAARVAKREVSASEVTEAVLARARERQPEIGAYTLLMEKEARSQAAAIDRRLTDGEKPGPLAGVPVALKDLLCTRGIPTTCGSRVLGQYRPPYDATVVEKLRAAGAVFIGKTNMDEFAMGSSTENSAFGPTRNPWDPERIPGGSSGGSAAAVADHQCAFSLGSDTGGSIRQPAALCGVVGCKPTYGRVSRYGLVAFASSLDQIGPFAKDVADCALVLQAISGHDSRDSTSLPDSVADYEAALNGEVRGLRLGLPKEYFGEWVDPAVASAVQWAAEELAAQGASVEEISLPHTEYGLAAYYIIAPAEASSNLARYDGVHYGLRRPPADGGLVSMVRKTRHDGFGPEVKRRIMLGTYVLSSGYYDAYYLKAGRVRTLIRREFDQAFNRVDAILTPTSPTPAFRLGEKIGDPLQMYFSDVATIPANLAGLPGISVPCGFSPQGLPIGLQILAPPLGEAVMLRVAHAYEQGTESGKKACLLNQKGIGDR